MTASGPDLPRTTGSGLVGRLGRIPPRVWLGVAVVAYFVVAFGISWLRLIELVPGTWDLGLYQQALWTTAHGRPFYEAADWETGGYNSLLQVHSVLLLYTLVPLYAAAPTPVTLLAVQAAVVAAAALPLYYLGRTVGGSGWYGLAAAGAYLAWAPLIGANLYDFHAEAFLPLEVFAVVALWERGRYGWGAVAATLAFLTLEVAPVLLFFVAVFFLIPPAVVVRTGLAERNGRPWGPHLWAAARRWISTPRVLATLALAASCVVAYEVLLSFRVDYLGSLLGVAPRPFPVTGYVIGGTPSELGLTGANLVVGFPAKVTYWLLLLALLGFVPLLAPRALVLALPWFLFTLFTSIQDFTILGFQYGFLAAAALLPAFAYGLPRAVRSAEAWRATASSNRPSEAAPAAPAARRRARGGAVVTVVVVAAFLAVNLTVSPLDPLMQNQTLGSGYDLSYTVPSGYTDVTQLAGLIPSNATVVASDDLFPLVANDPNAYSFLWTQDNSLVLPFNATTLPSYVFIDQYRLGAVPSWVEGLVYNTTDFAIRGVVWSSAVGPVLLFEHGYTGPTSSFGAAPSLPMNLTVASLVYPDAGYLPAGPVLGRAPVVASAPGQLGTFFWGPAGTLPGGNATVTLQIAARATGFGPPPTPDEPTVWIGSTVWGIPPFFGWAIPWSYFRSDGWTNLTFNITLPGPAVEFNVQGVALGTNVQVFLASVTVAAATTTD